MKPEHIHRKFREMDPIADNGEATLCSRSAPDDWPSNSKARYDVRIVTNEKAKPSLLGSNLPGLAGRRKRQTAPRGQVGRPVIALSQVHSIKTREDA